MASGIYRITNLKNGKIYIGSTKSFHGRKNMHFSELRRGTHHSKKLQKSFDKHGEASFLFEIIEECAIEDLLVREQYFIDLYDSFRKGYNGCPISGTPRGVVGNPKAVQGQIKKFYEDNGKMPSLYSKDITERRLRSCLSNYIREKSLSYDPEFTEWAKPLMPGNGDPVGKKQKLKAFYNTHGRLPSQEKSIEERNLYACLCNYSNPINKCYDPEFAAWINPLKTGVHSTERKDKIKEYYAKHGKLPSKYTSDGRPLYQAFHHYIDPKDDSYDPDFEEWARPKMGEKFRICSSTKEKIRDFYSLNNRLPSRGKDSSPEEFALGRAIANYISPKNRVRHLDFYDWYISIKN